MERNNHDKEEMYLAMKENLEQKQEEVIEETKKHAKKRLNSEEEFLISEIADDD